MTETILFIIYVLLICVLLSCVFAIFHVSHSVLWKPEKKQKFFNWHFKREHTLNKNIDKRKQNR